MHYGLCSSSLRSCTIFHTSKLRAAVPHAAQPETCDYIHTNTTTKRSEGVHEGAVQPHPTNRPAHPHQSQALPAEPHGAAPGKPRTKPRRVVPARATVARRAGNRTRTDSLHPIHYP
eukprot:1312226-Prymnesium_polylepis.1